MAKKKKTKKIKKTKESNHIVLIAVFLCIVVVIGAGVFLKTIKVSKEVVEKELSKYETIMKFDFVNEYPTDPNIVMDDYCYIIQYLYSNEIKEEEIPDVVAKSRELMHMKTLANTTLEEQIQGVKAEREIIAGTNSYVNFMTHLNVVIDKVYPNYADCVVTQYTNSGNDLIGDYVLQMEDYKWKVYSWELKGTNVKSMKDVEDAK